MAFDLQRFLDAQDEPGEDGLEGALEQLREGDKTGHWMWYVFPQLAGFGSSPESRRYGIVSLEEARAYAAHPVLGARLRDCCHALLDLRDMTALGVFHAGVDVKKLRSSMTLFERATGEALFGRVIDRYLGGERDAETLRRVA